MRTQLQQQILDDCTSQLRADVLHCLAKAKHAATGRVPLPHKNEAGESVLVGDNLESDSICDYWVQRANVSLWSMSREQRHAVIFEAFQVSTWADLPQRIERHLIK